MATGVGSKRTCVGFSRFLTSFFIPPFPWATVPVAMVLARAFAWRLVLFDLLSYLALQF